MLYTLLLQGHILGKITDLEFENHKNKKINMYIPHNWTSWDKYMLMGYQNTNSKVGVNLFGCAEIKRSTLCSVPLALPPTPKWTPVHAPGCRSWWQESPTLRCPFLLSPKMSSQAGFPNSCDIFLQETNKNMNFHKKILWLELNDGLLVGNSREVNGGNNCDENN